jgi:hypothetical protein
VISIVSIACVAATASAIAIGHRHSSTVRVIATTPTTLPSTSSSPVASVHDFADLDRARAWLAAAITSDAKRPQLVQAEIVRTTLHDFDRAENPTGPPSTAPDRAVYAIQLTGTTFVCNSCGGTFAGNGSALRIAWDPKIHFVATHDVGSPIDPAALGRVYTLNVGRPTTPAPTEPECGQIRGRASTIASETRLDHTVEQIPEIFTSPGSAQPAITAEQALQSLAASTPDFLAPRVTATLAVLNTVGNALVKGPRLVWILSVTNVEVVPSLGLPACGNAAVVIDATSNKSLVAFEGSVTF